MFFIQLLIKFFLILEFIIEKLMIAFPLNSIKGHKETQTHIYIYIFAGYLIKIFKLSLILNVLEISRQHES